MRKVLATGLLLLILAACSEDVHVASTSATPRGSMETQRPTVESCPKVAGGQGYAAVDYVDFIQAFGHQYVADFAGRVIPAPARTDLGEVVLRSRCSFAALNDRTHKDPGEARDGDTAFLAAGTPIHAIKGWSTQCRLAAAHNGRLHVYLAMEDHAAVATPRPCAESK